MMVPAYMESVLEARHKAQHGFTLQDTVDMVLMLDQLAELWLANLEKTRFGRGGGGSAGAF